MPTKDTIEIESAVREELHLIMIEAETDTLLVTPLRLKILNRHSGLTRSQLADMVKSLQAIISAEIGYLMNAIDEEVG